MRAAAVVQSIPSGNTHDVVPGTVEASTGYQGRAATALCCSVVLYQESSQQAAVSSAPVEGLLQQQSRESTAAVCTV